MLKVSTEDFIAIIEAYARAKKAHEANGGSKFAVKGSSLYDNVRRLVEDERNIDFVYECIALPIAERIRKEGFEYVTKA